MLLLPLLDAPLSDADFMRFERLVRALSNHFLNFSDKEKFPIVIRRTRQNDEEPSGNINVYCCGFVSASLPFENART